MAGYGDDIPEYDEIPEEYLDGLADEELEVSDVPWAKDIQQIEDPDLRLKEIQAAEKLIKKEENLQDQLDQGLIDPVDYDHQYQNELMSQKRKAATRCGLASIGLTYDDIGDLEEDYDFLLTSLTGDTRMMDLKKELKTTIARLGSDEAQELADGMYHEGKINEEAYQTISRQVRLNRNPRK